MTVVRSLSLVLVLAAAPVLASCASLSGGTPARLDGRTYKVMVFGAGGDKLTDDLHFRNGRFESASCKAAGFTPVPYHVEPAEGGVTFTARCDDPALGQSEWQGLVRGEMIEGTVTRTPKDGAAAPATFTGSLVK